MRRTVIGIAALTALSVTASADLNGDGSQDLVVIVNPIDSALPSINHPLAS